MVNCLKNSSVTCFHDFSCSFCHVGGLTSILKQFLNGVLKEVTSSERNHELDGMLLQYDGRARNYVNSEYNIYF